MNNLTNDDFLWKRLPQETRSNKLFLSSDRSRIFIMTREFEGDMYDCKLIVPDPWHYYYFDDCYNIDKMPLMSSLSCNPLIHRESIIRKVDGYNMPVKYNILSNREHKHNESLYPACINKKMTNKYNIRTSVEKWWKSMSTLNDNPFWFQPYSTTPFDDPRYPHINISINFFYHRKNFENMSYLIYSQAKLLSSGIMVRGKIYENVTATYCNEWSGPIKIVLKSLRSNEYNAANKKSSLQKLERHFIVFGKLYESKLNGITRIIGIAPNDPNDDCEASYSPELAFIGHYVEGIPSGYCWKGLLGGSRIFGKVDASGYFSGMEIISLTMMWQPHSKGSLKMV